MPAQVSIQSVDAAGQTIYVSFNVALSGNYPTGGDPLNFTSGGTLPVTQDPAFIGLVAAIESSQLLQIDTWSQGGNLGRSYVPIKASTNPQTGTKLKVNVLNTYGTEHAAAGYEGDITGDSITGFAIFSKLI